MFEEVQTANNSTL